MRLFVLISLFFTQVWAFDGGDPLFDQQWYLENTGQVHREEITDIKSKARTGVIGADIGWRQVAKTLKFEPSNRPKVAIIDSGIDYEHEDLSHSILLNEAECIAGDMPLGEASEDKDGNGYMGDCKGINLTTRDKKFKNRPLDELGHGTHMAGIISAKWNNGDGIVGIHQDIQILPIKAISEDELRQRRPLNERLAEAIRYAIIRNVDVINLSIGFPIARDTEDLRAAVREADAAGIFVVAAAGNNSHSVPVYPCAYDEVICVGSVRNDGNRSAFSNYGAHVDVYAPGEYIISTFPEQQTPSYSSVKGYETKSGTSQSAPIVSASLAILKKSYPNESHARIKRRLFQSLSSERVLRLDTLLTAKQPAQSTRLVFKDFGIANVSSQLTAEIPFVVQNLSQDNAEIRVQAKALTEGFQILNPRQTQSVESGKEAPFILNLKARDLLVSNKLEIEILVNNKLENLSVNLSRLFSAVPETKSYTIDGSSEVKSFGSVINLQGVALGQYYFETVVLNEPRGVKLKLWKRTDSKLEFVGEKVLSKTRNALAIYQADTDADGQDDIIVLGIGVERPDPDKDAFNTIHIHYFNKDLSPKYTETGLIEETVLSYFDFGVLVEYKDTRWIYKTLDTGERLLVPIVIASGFSPPADTSLRDKRRGGAPQAAHIYTLDPVRTDEGKLEFRTRIFDNAHWVSKIRKQYKLRFYEAVSPTMVLNDEAQFIVRLGQLEKSRYLLLSYEDGEWTETLLNWPRAVLGLKPIKVYNELTKEIDIGLMGLISKSRLQLILLNPENLHEFASEVIIDMEDESDYILKPLMVSKSATSLNFVLESGQKLFGYKTVKAKTAKVFSKELPRTTFFSKLLTQVNEVIQDTLGRPWTYVDDTQVNVNSIRLESFDPDLGFRTLLRDSYSIEGRCMPLNPARWSKQSKYSLRVLCRIADNIELRSLPIQVNTH